MEPMIVFEAPKPAVTISLANPVVGSGLFSVDAFPIRDVDTVDQVARRLLKVCRSATADAAGKASPPPLPHCPPLSILFPHHLHYFRRGGGVDPLQVRGPLEALPSHATGAECESVQASPYG